MKRSVIGMALAAVCAAGTAHAAFTTGDIYVHNYNGQLWKATPGASYSASAPFATATGGSDVGHMLWSADLSTLYVSNYGSVLAISSTGTVTTFATGFNAAMGLLRTQTGRMLVTDFGRGSVYDITAGGNFTSATPFASGLTNPTDLVQTPGGKIYASEFVFGGEVSDITAGGVIGAGQVYASGLDYVTSLINSPTGLMVASESKGVVAVNSAGNYTSATPFVASSSIWGIAYDAGGRLLAADYINGGVRDISAGGSYATAPVVSSGTSINAIAVVPAVPEPTVVAVVGSVGGLLLLRRRQD